MLVKPASRTPLSALALARLLIEAGLPAGFLSVLPSDPEIASQFVTDARVRAVSFTGSMEVGWQLKRLAWDKRVILELGGNAGAIVHEDADIAYAAKRIAAGAFGFAGQSCISVQRVFVHRPVWEGFLVAFANEARALRPGDPLDEATDVGPLVSDEAADREQGLIDKAIRTGATMVHGGERKGRMLSPTILTDCDPHLAICQEEAFGPVVAVWPYEDFAKAIEGVNDSRYGLQAGVFTRDIGRIWHAYGGLEVAGSWLMISRPSESITCHTAASSNFGLGSRGCPLRDRGADRASPDGHELGVGEPAGE